MKMAQPKDPGTGTSRARDRLDAVCERIRAGVPVTHACALERVATSSLYWLCEHDEAVAQQVAEARAAAAEAQRAELRDAALGAIPNANANVLLHLLERSHPDEYAPPKQRVEKSGVDGGPIQHEHAGRVVLDVTTANRISRQQRKEEP